MKSSLLATVLAFLATGTTLHAQRITTESYAIKANVLPSQPMPKSYLTYSASITEVENDMTNAGLLPNTLISEHFGLAAIKKLPKGGHFHINVEIGKLAVSNAETKTSSSTVTNKDGSKSTVNSYYREISYRMPIRLTVVDYTGKVWMEAIHGSPSEPMKHIFKNGNSNFATTADLNKAWGNGNEVYTGLRRKIIGEAMGQFGSAVKERYDTRESQDFVVFLQPKGKKFAEEDEFGAKLEVVKSTLAGVTVSIGLEPARAALQPVIAYWESLKDRYSLSNEDEAKIHYACLYNIGTAYLYMEEFDKVQGYIDACSKIDFKDNRTEALASQLKRITDALAKNSLTSRYAKTDLSTAESPAEADYSAIDGSNRVVLPSTSNNNIFEGFVITRSGDTLRGNFVVKGSFNEPKFAENGANTTFVYTSELYGSVTKHLDPNWFSEFGFNGRNFKSLDFRESTSIRGRNQIMEVLAIGKMNVYQLYHWYNKDNPSQNGAAELILNVQGQEDFISTAMTNLKLANWKENFAALFADCPALATRIRNGELPRNDGNILDAARAYNKNECE